MAFLFFLYDEEMIFIVIASKAGGEGVWLGWYDDMTKKFLDRAKIFIYVFFSVTVHYAHIGGGASLPPLLFFLLLPLFFIVTASQTPM